MAGEIVVSAKELARLCRAAGFEPGAQAQEALGGYLELLMKWNRVMNLVGPHTWQAVFRTLIVDSLHLARFVEGLPLPEAPECWDLGAGAGLPGIPLRALWQRGEYHMVEAREKRALFLGTALARVELPRTRVFRGRAEDFMPTRPVADLVVSRAFMPWRDVLALVGRYVAPGGQVVFLTREPLAEALPAGWNATGTAAYDVEGTTRYFWSLSPIMEAN